jgi:hypothetical protein
LKSHKCPSQRRSPENAKEESVQTNIRLSGSFCGSDHLIEITQMPFSRRSPEKQKKIRKQDP